MVDKWWWKVHGRLCGMCQLLTMPGMQIPVGIGHSRFYSTWVTPIHMGLESLETDFPSDHGHFLGSWNEVPLMNSKLPRSVRRLLAAGSHRLLGGAWRCYPSRVQVANGERFHGIWIGKKGKIYRKAPYLMGKSMVWLVLLGKIYWFKPHMNDGKIDGFRLRFSLKPIHWLMGFSGGFDGRW